MNNSKSESKPCRIWQGSQITAKIRLNATQSPHITFTNRPVESQDLLNGEIIPKYSEVWHLGLSPDEKPKWNDYRRGLKYAIFLSTQVYLIIACRYRWCLICRIVKFCLFYAAFSLLCPLYNIWNVLEIYFDINLSPMKKLIISYHLINYVWNQIVENFYEQ